MKISASWSLEETESTMDKIITDKMTINLDVFSPFMEDIIVSNMNDTLVIIIKRSGIGCRQTILKKPSSKLEEFRCSINKGMIFHFSTRVSHNGLFLTSLRD